MTQIRDLFSEARVQVEALEHHTGVRRAETRHQNVERISSLTRLMRHRGDADESHAFTIVEGLVDLAAKLKETEGEESDRFQRVQTGLDQIFGLMSADNAAEEYDLPMRAHTVDWGRIDDIMTELGDLFTAPNLIEIPAVEQEVNSESLPIIQVPDDLTAGIRRDLDALFVPGQEEEHATELVDEVHTLLNTRHELVIAPTEGIFGRYMEETQSTAPAPDPLQRMERFRRVLYALNEIEPIELAVLNERLIVDLRAIVRDSEIYHITPVNKHLLQVKINELNEQMNKGLDTSQTYESIEEILGQSYTFMEEVE